MRRSLLPLLLCLFALPPARPSAAQPLEFLNPVGGETFVAGDDVAVRWSSPWPAPWPGPSRVGIYLRDFNDPGGRWVRIKRTHVDPFQAGNRSKWSWKGIPGGYNSNRMALLIVLESDRSQKIRSNLFTMTDGPGKTDRGPGAPLTPEERADFRGVDDASEAPEAFALSAAYPNPFNPTTTLALSVPEAGAVRVRVYDPLGREVAVLADGELEAGEHELRFDAGILQSGTYFVRMEAGGASVTRAVSLLK